jgi:hypothetical protein
MMSRSVFGTAAASTRGGGGRRATEFLLPDGRSVLVALPKDIDALRRRYAQTHDADPPVQVEVVVHGSDEHRDYLRQSRTHHETRRAQLRDRLGAEAVDELDAARDQLDGLDAQLRAIDAATDEIASRLNPNFSKFGFDAKLRTYGGGDEGEDDGDVASSAVSARSVSTVEAGEAMMLFKRPVVRQYFHRGLLWYVPGTDGMWPHQSCQVFNRFQTGALRKRPR